MAAANIRAGGAFVELWVKDGTVQKTLSNVRKKFLAFGSTLQSIGLGGIALGGAVTAPMLAAVQSFAAAGSELNDLSAQTRVSTDALQTLGYAASQTGASTEALVGALGKMQKGLGAEDAKAMESELNRIGLTLKDLKGLSPDQQFRKIAASIANVPDSATRTAVAMGIFGKAAGDLIPLLSAGGAELAKMEDRLVALGGVMSKEDIAAADELGDRLDDLWGSLSRGKNIIGASLAPAMTMIVNGLIDAVTATTRFVNENRGMLITVAAVAGAILAGGIAFLGLGTVIAGIAVAIGGFMSLWAGVGTVLAAIAGSPILLVVAGLTAITLAFPQLRQAAGEALDFLFGGFGNLLKIATDTFGGISDAMSAGNMMLAAKILWAGLKLAWLTGTENIKAVWNEAVTSVANFGSNAFAGFRIAWAMTVKFIGDMWDVLLGGMGGKWSEVQNNIARGFVNAWAKISGIPEEDLVASLEEEQKAQQQASTNRMRIRQEEYEKKKKQIEDDRKSDVASNEAQKNANNQANADGITAAQQELAALRAEAAQAKQTRADQLAATARRATVGGGEATSLVGSIGSFSAFAAGRIGIAGVSPLQKPLEDTAKNTEEIAKNTKEGAVWT